MKPGKNTNLIKECWKLLQPVAFACLATVVLVLVAMPAKSQSATPGACLVEDTAFATADGGCMDLATGQVWSEGARHATGSGWTWSGAKNYCANLNEAGYSDWSMPTLLELETVTDNGAAGHLNVGSVAPPEANAPKWTIDKKGRYAWTVRLEDGLVALWWWYTSFDVVCVR